MAAEPPGQEGPYLRALGRRRPLAHQVGDQPCLALGVGLGHDGRARDVRMFQQAGLDLAHLDPVAAHLHLVVHSSEEVHLPGRVPRGQISGAVEPSARRPEGVGHKAVGGRARPPEIAVGEAVAADQQLAGDADGRGPQPFVDDMDPGVADRRPDAHPFRPLGDLPPGGPDRRLRGPVDIEQPGGRRAQLPGQRQGQRLAADQCGQAGRTG